MNSKGLLILFLLVIMSGSGFAQDEVSFTGSAKQMVTVGERFRVVYEVNGDGRNFTSPDFGSLQVLSGPNTSTNSSVQYINGRMSQSYSKTFTFIVQATIEGEVSVSPAKVKVDGKTYSSNSLSIQVGKSPAGQQPQSAANASASNSQEDGVLQDDDVYIKAFVNNTNPYLGEQIILTYKIYTKVPVSNISSSKSASFAGFWSKNLMDDRQQLKQSSQVINGEEYIVADISSFALFPQKSGALTIEPFELDCNVQLRVQSKRKRGYDPFEDFFNDPFFNRNVKNIKTTLKSKPLKINVKPLPQANKPESFTGAVGSFTFSAGVDQQQLKANDALTLSINLSGKGNIELINFPDIQFPTDFETFEPKITSNISANAGGVSGSKKFEYLVLPRNAGDFEVKPVAFSYFDPNKEEYIRFSSDPFSIHVSKDDNSSPGVTYSSSAQEDIRFIGQDIHHIKDKKSQLQPVNAYFFATNWYYLLMWLPVVLLILVVVVWKQQEKRHADLGLMKNRKANKVAKNRLQKADKFRKAGDDKSFFDEIALALWGYIADKFSLPQATLSLDTVREALKERHIEDGVIDNFINTLNNIEFARFAPGDSGGKMETVYNESLNAIMRAEKALK